MPTLPPHIESYLHTFGGYFHPTSTRKTHRIKDFSAIVEVVEVVEVTLPHVRGWADVV